MKKSELERILLDCVIRGGEREERVQQMEVDVANCKRILKQHGEAHLVQDLLPQFTQLVKKVESLEGKLNFKLNDGPIFNHGKRIATLEKQVNDTLDIIPQLNNRIQKLEDTVNSEGVRIEILEEKVVKLDKEEKSKLDSMRLAAVEKGILHRGEDFRRVMERVIRLEEPCSELQESLEESWGSASRELQKAMLKKVPTAVKINALTSVDKKRVGRPRKS